MITTDVHGNVTFLNPVAERMTAWSSQEAAGEPLERVFQIINENTRETALSPVRRVLRDGKVVGLANHTALIAKDGTETPIDDSAAPIRDAAGRVLGAVMIFHDVTLRRRTEAALREETRILELLNAAGSGIAAELNLHWQLPSLAIGAQVAPIVRSPWPQGITYCALS